MMVLRNQLRIFQQRAAFHLHPIVQKNFSSTNSYQGEGLKEYIERGKAISKNPTKSLLYLEDLIKDYDKSEIYSKLLSTKEYETHGIKDEFFIALTLPSLTGKTQMAFSIRSKRPLYFSLQKTQNVNKPFYPITMKLKRLLESDLDKAQKIIKSKIRKTLKDDSKNTLLVSNDTDEYTSTFTIDHLEEYLHFHKFDSLGFIVSLIKECEKLFKKVTNDDWMKFYSDNQNYLRFIKYEPISFEDLDEQESNYPLLQKYFIFIDEFSTDPSFVFLRNMCLYIRTPCVLTSSDPKVVNLIGVTTNRSGSSTPSVYCALIPKLSGISDIEIERLFNDPNRKHFLELARNVSESEERRMSLLLEFFKDQVKKTRPGVAMCLFEALNKISKKFKSFESLKVDDLFQEVFKFMIDSIKNRRITTFDTESGMAVNVNFLKGDKFDSNYEPDKKYYVGDTKKEINDHFFYMKYPRIDPNSEEPCLLFNNNKKKTKLLPRSKSINDFDIQAYFDEKEELLKLICLFSEMRSSSYRIDDKSYKSNRYEYVTYSAFLTSSHCNDKTSLTLDGVRIKDFLKNLLGCFNENMEYFNANREHLKVNYESVKDDQFMSSTIVPSLYIVNHDWPAELKAIFNPKDSTSVKLGKYTLIPDRYFGSKARVDLIDKDGRNRLGVIEYKDGNYYDCLSSYNHMNIIENSIEEIKMEKIETFLTAMRPLINQDMIKSFENYINDFNFDSEFYKEKGFKSSKTFIKNFENFDKIFKSSRKNKWMNSKIW